MTVNPDEVLKKFGLDVIIGNVFDLKPVNATIMLGNLLQKDKLYILAYSDAGEKEMGLILDQIPEEIRNMLSGLVPGQTGSEDKYSTYLPIAQKMMNSFDIIDGNPQPIANSSQSTDNESLKILDLRLAKGEITVQEYQELKKILGQQYP